MATGQNPKEFGIKILAIYCHYNVRPGEMLLLDDMNIWWKELGGYRGDLVAGLEWLREKGYIERQDGRNKALFLTKDGFAAR